MRGTISHHEGHQLFFLSLEFMLLTSTGKLTNALHVCSVNSVDSVHVPNVLVCVCLQKWIEGLRSGIHNFKANNVCPMTCLKKQ